MKGAGPAYFFGSKPDLGHSALFQQVLEAPQSPRQQEHAKIEYLLERLKQSGMTFKRNGEIYSNGRAAVHLRWKYHRISKRIHTVRNFVLNVATRSKISGKDYLVEIRPGEYYSSGKILLNELNLLEEALEQTGGPGQVKPR